MKHETPNAQQAMYDHGIELAHAANQAFDRRVAATNKLVALDVAATVPGVDVSEDARRAVVSEAVRAQGEHLAYSDAVGALIGPNVFQKLDSTESEKFGVLSRLSPEQKVRAAQAAAAMAEQFGVDEKDFAVVATGTEEGESKFAVIFAAGNGIDLGDSAEDFDPKRSWDSITGKKNYQDFVVVVDGKEVDTRKGMTETVYNALIDRASQTGEPLPDSPQLADATDQPWTATWLTGEKADESSAPFASVARGGTVRRSLYRRVNVFRALRFRPAVEL